MLGTPRDKGVYLMPSKKKLSERSEATLGEIFANPNKAFTIPDLASAGVLGSYSTMKNWLDRGWFPPPHELPNGRKIWLGSEIAAALRRRSAQPEGKQA